MNVWSLERSQDPLLAPNGLVQRPNSADLGLDTAPEPMPFMYPMRHVTRAAMKAFWDLEDLGRTQLSNSFFLRDFLHSEIAATYSLPNIPQCLQLR